MGLHRRYCAILDTYDVITRGCAPPIQLSIRGRAKLGLHVMVKLNQHGTAAPRADRSQVTAERSLESVAEEIALAVAATDPNPNISTYPRAYIVGGWCRDRVLGKSSPDVDMEVFGVAPQDLTGTLQSLGYHVIAPKTFGTTPWKVIAGSLGSIDVTIPLRSIPTNKNVDVLQPAPDASVAEAATRRDFTCNAIYFDPVRNEFIDPHQGAKDLSDGVLKLLPGSSLNPGIPLRACRMAAQFNLTLDQTCKEQIGSAVLTGILRNLSRQHLTKELLKMLTESPAPSKGLLIADELGVLQQIFPDISALKQVPQDPRHHPEGDVLTHTMMVVDEAAKLSASHDREQRRRLMLGALFHDVGKLHATQITEKEGQRVISAHGHEQAGIAPSKHALSKLELAHPTRQGVLRLVANHMKPLELHGVHPTDQTKERYDNKVRMLVRSVGKDNFAVFADLVRADQLGRGGSGRNPGPIIEPILEAVTRNNFLSPENDRLLSGRTLKELGIEDAHGSYEEILREIETRRDAGTIKTTEDARKYVLRHHSLTGVDLEKHGVFSPADKKLFFKSFGAGVRGGEICSRGDALALLGRFTETTAATPPNLSMVTDPKLLFKATAAELAAFGETITSLISDEFALIVRAAHKFVGAPSNNATITARIVSRDVAAQIHKGEFERYYGTDRAQHYAPNMEGVAGFFHARESTVYLVPENLWPCDFDLIRSTLFHEVVHGIQSQTYPDYESTYLAGLLSKRAAIEFDTNAPGLVRELTKSIQALRHWQECHARYFESLYADDNLWDDPSQTIEQVRWVLGLDTLFANSCVRESLLPNEVEPLVNQIFSEPWLADAAFRDDGVVCAEVAVEDRSAFERAVLDFCKRYTTREHVQFVYLS